MAEATEEQLKNLTEDEPTAIEELAMETGWAPKDDWRGDEEAWVDAPAFIRQGRENLKSSLAKQDKQLEGMESLKGTVAEFKEHMENTDKRAYDRAIKDLKAKQREAVEEGDTEVYDSIQEEIEDIDKEVVASQPKKTEDRPPRDPVFDAWIPDNKWYNGKSNDDVFLTGRANAEVAPTIATTFPEIVGTREYYDKISEQLRKDYPDRFGKSSRTRPAAVEGAGTGGGEKPSEGKKSYADLPQDAKEICDRFIGEGLVKDKDAYVSQYYGEDE